MSPHPFFSHAPATPTIYTLSLHDALPIWIDEIAPPSELHEQASSPRPSHSASEAVVGADSKRNSIYDIPQYRGSLSPSPPLRSEEHTSELQSRFDLVCRLLLEKKKLKQKRLMVERLSIDNKSDTFISIYVTIRAIIQFRIGIISNYFLVTAMVSDSYIASYR